MATTKKTTSKTTLSKQPTFKLATSLEALDKQRNDKNLQQYRPQIAEAIKKIRAQQAAATTQPTTEAPAAPTQTPGTTVPDNTPIQGPAPQSNPMYDSWYNSSLGGNQAIANQFQYIQNQGAFNPGDFKETQQKAYDSVMNEFNRTKQPQFDKEAADFQQMAAERGWDPNSEAYKTTFAQMKESQGQQKQSAMNAAYGQGLGAQQQAFGQSVQSYQMPYQNLSAFSPFYQGAQSQYQQDDMQGFQGTQNAYDRQQQFGLANLNQGFNKDLAAQQFGYSKDLADIQQGYGLTNAQLAQKYAMQQLEFQAAHRGGGGGGGGGGGSNLQDQIALQNNGFYNNLALMAAQGGGQQANPWNGAIAGAAQGFGAGIGQGLLK